MRLSKRSICSATLALALILTSCSDAGMTSPEPAGPVAFSSHASLPAVRISEIHYDNDGTDTGEAIEVEGPAGTDLTGWSLVLYNGSGGVVYRTTALAGTIPAVCGARGVVVVEYPSNGIQNGSPDGVALVDAAGAVVEFLSYEGTITAADGPAAGTASVDIGVAEGSSTLVGHSLQRTADGAWSAPQASTFGACNRGGVEPPPPPPAYPATRIEEIHYDNDGTDAGEAVEIAGPAGTDLAGWSLVLYNGNGGTVYRTIALEGTIPAVCDTRGVVVVPTAGIQNGSPDGVALVDAAGAVVEFLSYEGTITAADGPAAGTASVDIGVAEGASTPVGHSLQRAADGAWQAPRPASFGACNGGVAPPPSGTGPLVIHELMGEPVNAESASWGEWFEVYNPGTEAVELQGWTIVSGGQASHVVRSSVVVPAGGYAVLGRGSDPARNGGVTLAYNYYSGSSTIWLDRSDWLALRDPAGATVDSVRWSGLPEGATRALRDASADNADVDGAAWGYTTTPFGAGDYGTPGAANGALSDTAPAPPAGGGSISVFGRDGGDPPLPVGFQDQLFATLRDRSGNVVATTFTWSVETPGLATVDADGVVTATGAGTAVVRVTAADDAATTTTVSIPTRHAVASATAQYAGNTEFGEPADADASDDFIVRHAQFTASYNPGRGTPNWVGYDLDATHFGPEDRCDCFTADPSLPSSFTVLTTADYTGAGGYHGYGIDRGHLVRSFDRTGGSLDNAVTYYFTNIIPQAADLNQGPWAALEQALGDRARFENREVYIVAGVAGSRGTVKGEGKIVIPESVWKVAVVLPRDHGLDDVDDHTDLEVIAVAMPNVAGIRNASWTDYQTTVDAVEALSGYDLLALLPDAVERIVESGTRAPTAAVDGPYASIEGEAVAMSAAASSDPDGDALAFAWSFGDGATASGAEASHTYAQGGEYTVRLVVSDVYGLADTVTTVVAVQTRSQALRAIAAEIDAMVAAGTVNGGNGRSLAAKLEAAAARIEQGPAAAALHPIRAFVHEVEAMRDSGRLAAAPAQALIAAAERVIRTL